MNSRETVERKTRKWGRKQKTKNKYIHDRNKREKEKIKKETNRVLCEGDIKVGEEENKKNMS